MRAGVLPPQLPSSSQTRWGPFTSLHMTSPPAPKYCSGPSLGSLQFGSSCVVLGYPKMAPVLEMNLCEHPAEGHNKLPLLLIHPLHGYPSCMGALLTSPPQRLPGPFPPLSPIWWHHKKLCDLLQWYVLYCKSALPRNYIKKAVNQALGC